MAKMKMPKMGGKAEKPHVRMRKMKPAAPSAFPPSPMAFPPQDPTGGAGMGAGGAAPDPSSAMAAPPTAGPPAGGTMGQ